MHHPKKMKIKDIDQCVHYNFQRDIIGLQRNVELRLNAERDNIPNRKRQFAFDACDNVWWRRVSRHKPVKSGWIIRLT